MLVAIATFSPLALAGNGHRVRFVETTEERARRAFSFAFEEGGTETAAACPDTVRALGFDPGAVPEASSLALEPGDAAIFRESGRWFFAEILPG